MADLQILIEVLGKNLAGGALGDVHQDLDKLEQKSMSTSQAMVGVGGAMTGVGVAGAAMFGAAISAASDFEKTMSGVKAVMSPDEVNTFGASLEALALKLGKDTAFSAKEAAEGIEQLVKGGVSAEAILNGAAEATLNLAAAGGVSLPDAAEIASNAMAMFGIKGEGMAHVADMIAGAANASSMEVTDFKFALNQVGAVATTVGLSFDDTATAISVMAAQGLKGSDAGTSLKTMLINLVPQTDKAAGAFRQYGLETVNATNVMEALQARGIDATNLSLEDQLKTLTMSVTGWSGMGEMTKKQSKDWDEAQGALRIYQNAFFDSTGTIKSFADISGILKDKLGDLSAEEQIVALKTLFGTDAMRAASIMMRTGAEGADAMAEALSKVTAAEVGAARMDNLQGALEALSGSFETLQITIGQKLLPYLRTLTETATGILNGFLELPEPVQNTAVAIGLAVTAVGLLVGPLLILAGMLPTLAAGFALMAAPIAAVAIPVVALTAAVALLAAAWINDWGDMRTNLTAIWEEGLKPVFDALGEVFGLMGEMLGSLLGDWVRSWQQIGDTTEEEGKQASAVAKEIARWLREDLTPAIKSFADWWREHWEQIKTVITVAAEVLATPFKAIMALTQALIDIWGLVLPAVKAALDPVLTYLGEWKDRLLPQVGAVWDGIITAGQKFFNDMVTNITTGLAKWVEPFRVGLENLTNMFGGWFGKTQTAANTNMATIGTSSSAAFANTFEPGMENSLLNVHGHSIMEDWAQDTVTGFPPLMTQIAEMSVGAFDDAFTSGMAEAMGTATGIAQKGMDDLQQIIGGGGAAYPGGGLGLPTPPGGGGDGGGGAPGGGPVASSGGGKNGGPGNSTERNQFGFKEWVSGEGSAYPGSSLSAWGQNVKPFKLAEIYANAFAGMAPGLAQPKTSSITSRVVGAQTPGPTGTSGPSYAPDAAMIARYGGLVNATIAMALAGGTKTPEQAAAEYAQNRQYEAVTGNVIGSGGGGYGPGQAAYEAEIRRAAQQEADARARREAAAFVLNVTNNGVSPDEVTQAITDNLNRLIWQAGME